MKDDKGEPIFNSWLEKLKAVYFPPGYFPGVDVVPFFHWWSMADHTVGIPEVDTRNLYIYNLTKTKFKTNFRSNFPSKNTIQKYQCG